jgi:beta-aspartyl-dipeptidase (metallo-type)
MTGKAGIVHLHIGDGERGLDLLRRALSESEIPARVYNPTHVNRRKALFDEAIALAANGCTIDLTAFPVAEDDDAWSADQAIIKYLDSDAPASNLTVSSDGGGCLPVFDENGVLTQMDVGDSSELMVALRAVTASGLSLEDALPFFTSNIADGLRLTRKGRIGPGMDADLVVLDEHKNIDAVMARGRWHVRDGNQEIKGMFEGE